MIGHRSRIDLADCVVVSIWKVAAQPGWSGNAAVPEEGLPFFPFFQPIGLATLTRFVCIVGLLGYAECVSARPPGLMHDDPRLLPLARVVLFSGDVHHRFLRSPEIYPQSCLHPQSRYDLWLVGRATPMVELWRQTPGSRSSSPSVIGS